MYIRLAILILGLAGAARLAPAQVTPEVQREIRGWVRSAATNQPIPGATVYLSSDIGEVIQQSSPEASGFFVFPYLSKAIYYVSARAPGYREVRQRADLNILRRVSVHLMLVPEPVPAGASAPGPPVDQRYLQVPEAARREFEHGQQQLRAGNLKKCVEHLRKAISLHADFPLAHLLLGTVYMDLQRWEDARQALVAAVALDDKQPAAHLSLGVVLARLGRFADAVVPLQRGLELNPQTADGHLELARVFWALQRPSEAEPHLLRTIELRPETPLAHLLLGNVLLRRRDVSAALRHFREYLRLEPQGPFAADTRQVIARLERAGRDSNPPP